MDTLNSTEAHIMLYIVDFVICCMCIVHDIFPLAFILDLYVFISTFPLTFHGFFLICIIED